MIHRNADWFVSTRWLNSKLETQFTFTFLTFCHYNYNLIAITTALFSVLNNTGPSTLDPAHNFLLQRRQQQNQNYGKLGFGGAVNVLSPGTAEKTLQDQHKINYTETPVPALRKANSPSTNSSFSSDSEEEDEDMGPRNQPTASLSEDGKAYIVPKKTYEAMTKDLNAAKQSLVKLKADKKELQLLVKDKDKTIGDVTAKLEKKRSKAKPGSRKDEQNDDVKDSVKDFVKRVLFRTVKFAQPGPELKAATLSVWKGVKDAHQLDQGPNPLTQSDFMEIYDSWVLSCLSDCRQYAQTRGEVAAKGTIWCILFFVQSILH